MVPVKGGEWEYRHETIIELRKRLGITQTQMAKQLDVPANTLYRWETGLTTPDAKSLAGIYSLGMQQGITPNFFKRNKAMKNRETRSRLIVMWDFQNVGVSDYYANAASDWIKEQFTKLFPSINNRLLKVFASPNQSTATDVLSDQGWRVWEDENDFDDEIYDQARSDCLQDPQSSVLVLITKDGDYKDMIEEFQQKGIRVYIIGPWDTNKDLKEVVGSKRFVDWPLNLAMAAMQNAMQSSLTHWVKPPGRSTL